jgi:hypothetical protein
MPSRLLLEVTAMTHKSFPETINERLAAIKLVVPRVAQGCEESDLRDLRILLIDVIGMLKRDPGVEAAADDLYAAAAAVVRDNCVHSQPAARKLRLLIEAGLRFCGRVREGEGIEPEDGLAPRGIAALYAAQVGLRAASADVRNPLTR